jgi:hypothetical protein
MPESSDSASARRRRRVLRLTDEELANLQLTSDQVDLAAEGHHHHDDSAPEPEEPDPDNGKVLPA